MSMRLGAVLLAALALSACDNTVSRGISSLGQGFIKAFNANPNSEPVDASSVKLTIEPTKDPFNP